MKKKLLAIDGNSVLNRAFYGVRPLSTKDGFPTNALFGFVNMITRQAEALSPDYVAVAFDLKAPTFRHKMYDAYKAGRRPMPEELALQFPVAKELLSAMGYHVLSLEGYEADDLLGTLAAMATREDVDAYLLTGDRDALQLISKNVHVLLATNTETVDMDEAKFFEKYGVPSSVFVDVKALMGDSSDNIPGVPGIGEKTALKLIAEYGSLDGVYEALPTAKHTPSVRAKLESGKESAYLSQSLARICCEAPLEATLTAFADRGMERAALRALFLRLEFSAFIKRFGLDAEADAPAAREVETEHVSVDGLRAVLADAKTVALDGENGQWSLLVGDKVYKTEMSAAALCELLAPVTVAVYDATRTFCKIA